MEILYLLPLREILIDSIIIPDTIIDSEIIDNSIIMDIIPDIKGNLGLEEVEDLAEEEEEVFKAVLLLKKDLMT